jgi:hypothetical protein
MLKLSSSLLTNQFPLIKAAVPVRTVKTKLAEIAEHGAHTAKLAGLLLFVMKTT